MQTGSELIKEGKKEFDKGNYHSAAVCFQNASTQFERQSDLISAAEAANNQGVALLKDGNPQAAFLAIEGTDTVFSKAGDHRREGMALGNLGEVLSALNRTDEAIEQLTKSLEIFTDVQANDLIPAVQQSLSKLYIRTGKPIEALTYGKSVVELSKLPKFLKKILSKFLNLPFS